MPFRNYSTSLSKVESESAASERKYQTLWEISETATAEKNQKVASEASYLAQLKNFNQQRGAFSPLAISDHDIPAHKKIKKKINAIVEKELALQDFKDKLDQEALSNEAYTEVVTRKNFFF